MTTICKKLATGAWAMAGEQVDAQEPAPVAPSMTGSLGGAPMGGPVGGLVPLAGPGGMMGPGGPDGGQLSPLALPGNLPNAFMRMEDHRTRFCSYITVDWLNWRIAGMSLPPLVTTTPNPSETEFGALDNPATRIIVGNENRDFGVLNGVRLTGGWALDWFPPVEISGFYVESSAGRDIRLHSDANGFPLLARPLFAAQPGVNNQVVFISAFPANAVGGVLIQSHTLAYGAEANVFMTPLSSEDDLSSYTFDLSFGMRYLALEENLRISASTSSIFEEFQIFFGQEAFGPGFTTVVGDFFRTQNYFYGGQIGAQMRWSWCIFDFSVGGKLALGQTTHIRDARGISYLNGPEVALVGGVLALPSNSGKVSATTLGIVPEFNTQIDIFLAPNVKVFVGYTFLYWNRVARPGDQIGLRINTGQAPTDRDFDPNEPQPTLPTRPLRYSDVWLHGLNLGVGFAF
jgi:hypothetical protein